MSHILNDEDGICRDIANQNHFSLFRIYRTEGAVAIERAKSSARGRHVIGNLPGHPVRAAINNAHYEGSSVYR